MPAHPDARLLLSLLVSLLLHGAALGGADLFSALRKPPPRPTPAMLTAMLVPPAPPPEPVLKDTLAESEAPAPQRPLDTQSRGRRPLAAAQRKLAEHLYYPEEAVARGLEGEVRLLLRLDAGGGVIDAEVAGSSGHAILDQAAVRAAHAMGALPGQERRELILPVVFRLRP